MTIDCHTLDSDSPTMIDYRMKGADTWQIKTAVNHNFPYSERIIHQVELTCLQSGSKYEFHFGEDSGIYRFRTMPDKLTLPLSIAIGARFLMYFQSIILQPDLR